MNISSGGPAEVQVERPRGGLRTARARTLESASPFTRDDLLRVMHAMNPWWMGRSISPPETRRPFQPECLRHALGTDGPPGLLLSGVRGGGKTTALLQTAKDLVTAGFEPRAVAHLNLRHPMMSSTPLSQLLHIYREMVHAPGARSVLLLDELPSAAGWNAHVRRVLDESAGHRIVATESMRTAEDDFEGAGQSDRWRVVRAAGPTFREHLERLGLRDPARSAPFDLFGAGSVSQAVVTELAHDVAQTKDALLSYLAGASSFTAAEKTGDAETRRDLTPDATARAIEDVKRLLAYLCLNSGEVFAAQPYSRNAGLSTSTVAAHLDLLERSFLIRRIAPVGVSTELARKARFRVYAADNVVRAAHVAQIRDPLADRRETRRAIRVALAFHAEEHAARTGGRLRYWRDPRTGRTVDLVIRHEHSDSVIHLADGSRAPDEGVLAYCRRAPVARAVLVTTDGARPEVLRVRGLETEFVRLPVETVLASLA